MTNFILSCPVLDRGVVLSEFNVPTYTYHQLYGLIGFYPRRNPRAGLASLGNLTQGIMLSGKLVKLATASRNKCMCLVLKENANLHRRVYIDFPNNSGCHCAPF